MNIVVNKIVTTCMEILGITYLSYTCYLYGLAIHLGETPQPACVYLI